VTTLTEPPTTAITVPTAARRRRFRRFLIVTHRWIALLLGTALLTITTSGAVLLYRPEIQRSLHQDAYATSGRSPAISLLEARRVVLGAHPTFKANSVWAEHGVFRVTDYTTSYTVDPGTGEILGRVGKSPTWLGVLDNLHECFFTCEERPWHVKVLSKEIPGTAWLGHDDARLTGGALVLGSFGFLLLYLCLTGIWLWFPRPGRWKAAVSVRWKRGRFARDTDLHNVAGIVALPMLLLWAVTGAGYELEPVEQAWYGVTPGAAHTGIDAVSKKLPRGVTKPDVTAEDAVAAATALRPHDRLVSVDVPANDDPTAAYTMYFQSGYDPWGKTEYPGEIGVFVDRHTGVAKTYYGFDGNSKAQLLWDDFNYPTHTGYIVDGWWRIMWLVLGLAPLVLAITGMSTWLVRRRTRRMRATVTAAACGPNPDQSPIANASIAHTGDRRIGRGGGIRTRGWF
jgi:uncharacterized iron-regulated membrane protein